jgi:TolB protein
MQDLNVCDFAPSNGTVMNKLLCFLLVILVYATPSFPQSKPGLAYQLTYSVNDDPFPSPDGKQLVYDSMVEGKYQLFIMDVDGKNQRQITRDPAGHETPSWSPDGKKIAYVSDRNGHSVIYIMNTDGSGEERLTDENAESIHPTWSPDGTSVLYCADDDLRPPKKNDASVYSVDIKTKQVKTLVAGGTNTYPN